MKLHPVSEGKAVQVNRFDKELRAAYPVSNTVSLYPLDRITQSKHQD
jgi:hypothetical protein